MASNPETPTPSLTKVENEPEDARADVTAAVEELLNTLSNKFAGVSSEIFAKSESLASGAHYFFHRLLTSRIVDDMSERLDKLEAALKENQAKDGGPSK
ncbi:uncharacterized protein AUP68_14943 [Ilyonectria robusta]